MNEQVAALLRSYDTTLAQYTKKRVEDVADDGNGSLGHLRWMIETMLTEGVEEDWSVGKTNRWLGFIQGTMWGLGLIGIQKLRDQSRDLYPEPV